MSMHFSCHRANNENGDEMMKSSKEMLTSILKTTQIAQTTMRTALNTSMRPSLRKTLESQLQEYDAIESEAHLIAYQRGWELPELDPSIRLVSGIKARAKLKGANSDSKIADMIIQRDTKGMINSLKDLHQFNLQDNQIRVISQKLLDCETAGIRQMHPFL